MEEKFSDTTTYIKLSKDPTQDIKQEIAQQLNSLLEEGIIDKTLKRQLYPKETQVPRAWLAEDTQRGIPTPRDSGWNKQCNAKDR